MDPVEKLDLEDVPNRQRPTYFWRVRHGPGVMAGARSSAQVLPSPTSVSGGVQDVVIIDVRKGPCVGWRAQRFMGKPHQPWDQRAGGSASEWGSEADSEPRIRRQIRSHGLGMSRRHSSSPPGTCGENSGHQGVTLMELQGQRVLGVFGRGWGGESLPSQHTDVGLGLAGEEGC